MSIGPRPSRGDVSVGGVDAVVLLLEAEDNDFDIMIGA